MKLDISGSVAVNNAVEWINENTGTSGARSLARVLLHAYNHLDQPLDITEICLLDTERQNWAWSILRLRVHGVEPHEVATDKRAFEVVIDNYWISTPEQQDIFNKEG